MTRLSKLAPHQQAVRNGVPTDDQTLLLILRDMNTKIFKSDDMKWSQTKSVGTVLVVFSMAAQVVQADPDGVCDPRAFLEGARLIMTNMRNNPTTTRRVVSDIMTTLKPYFPPSLFEDDESDSDVSDEDQADAHVPNETPPFLFAEEVAQVQVMLGENPPMGQATLVPNTDMSEDIQPPPIRPLLRRSRARSRSITESPRPLINMNEALIRSMNGHIRRLHSYWRGMSEMCGTADDGTARQLQF